MAGFSLLEVMVALCLFAAGIISIWQIQLRCQTSFKNNYYRQIALEQSLAITERLQVNTSAAHRFSEIRDWNEENNQLLPEGIGKVMFGTRCHLSISWKINGKTQLFYFPSR
jgi:prepilin-type N-terminal cleavage/methylation domain-containing protein